MSESTPESAPQEEQALEAPQETTQPEQAEAQVQAEEEAPQDTQQPEPATPADEARVPADPVVPAVRLIGRFPSSEWGNARPQPTSVLRTLPRASQTQHDAPAPAAVKVKEPVDCTTSLRTSCSGALAAAFIGDSTDSQLAAYVTGITERVTGLLARRRPPNVPPHFPAPPPVPQATRTRTSLTHSHLASPPDRARSRAPAPFSRTPQSPTKAKAAASAAAPAPAPAPATEPAAEPAPQPAQQS